MWKWVSGICKKLLPSSCYAKDWNNCEPFAAFCLSVMLDLLRFLYSSVCHLESSEMVMIRSHSSLILQHKIAGWQERFSHHSYMALLELGWWASLQPCAYFVKQQLPPHHSHTSVWLLNSSSMILFSSVCVPAAICLSCWQIPLVIVLVIKSHICYCDSKKTCNSTAWHLQ